MKTFKVGYYKANTAQGVFYYDTILDESETDVLPIKLFMDSLSDIEDGEEITAFFGHEDEAVYREVFEEYGIN